MKNSELATKFVNGATKGKTENVFIEGNALFSYGHHFGLAFRVNNNTFLLNTDRYSSSTSKHQSYIRSALIGETIIECNTKQISRAINYPDEPIIIEKIRYSEDLDEILEMLKQALKMKRFPRKKLKTQFESMKVLEAI